MACFRNKADFLLTRSQSVSNPGHSNGQCTGPNNTSSHDQRERRRREKQCFG